MRVHLSTCQVCGSSIVRDRRWWPWARWRHSIGPRDHQATRYYEGRYRWPTFEQEEA